MSSPSSLLPSINKLCRIFATQNKCIKISIMNKPPLRAYIAWIAICIIWGTTYLAIRIGVTDLPPMLFAGSRWIAAGRF